MRIIANDVSPETGTAGSNPALSVLQLIAFVKAVVVSGFVWAIFFVLIQFSAQRHFCCFPLTLVRIIGDVMGRPRCFDVLARSSSSDV